MRNKNDTVVVRMDAYYDWSRISFFSLNITATGGERRVAERAWRGSDGSLAYPVLYNWRFSRGGGGGSPSLCSGFRLCCGTARGPSLLSCLSQRGMRAPSLHGEKTERRAGEREGNWDWQLISLCRARSRGGPKFRSVGIDLPLGWEIPTAVTQPKYRGHESWGGRRDGIFDKAYVTCRRSNVRYARIRRARRVYLVSVILSIFDDDDDDAVVVAAAFVSSLCVNARADGSALARHTGVRWKLEMLMWFWCYLTTAKPEFTHSQLKSV